MKRTVIRTIAAAGLCVIMLAASIPASAAYDRPEGGGPSSGMSQSMGGGGFGGQAGGFGGAQQPGNQAPGAFGQQQNGFTGGMPGGQMGGDFGGVMQNQQPGGQMGQQPGSQMNQFPGWDMQGQQPSGQMQGGFGGFQDGNGAPAMNEQAGPVGQSAPFEQGQMSEVQSSTGEATEIVAGITTNSAASLEADYSSAVTYDVSQTGSVKIKSAGTYIITGTASDANITVTKGTTGVVLVLQDLNLTSTEGAALAINKTAEAKIIISGSVTLTDAEDPADEDSTDADVADAYDGAAIKVKAGAAAYITGSGTLTINGTAKNGIKAGDETALVIDGPTVNITAANDGINGNYDVALLSGKVTISAGDDGIHADRILTIGADVTVNKSTEGIEATVVNVTGGTVNVTASDDGVNAANSDGTYAGELSYSINMTGGSLTVNTSADGLDSNGNINLVDGSATIKSAYNGGDAGIDYDGSLYISDTFKLNNVGGVAGPDNMMGGMPGQMDGQMGGMNAQMGFSGGPNANGGMNAPNTNNGGMGGFGGMNGGFQPGR